MAQAATATKPAPVDKPAEPTQPEQQEPAQPVLASDVLDNADDLFRRGKKASPSPYQPDVQASLDNKQTRRIPIPTDRGEDADKPIVNGLRKAAREIGCSLQVKVADGYVVFRAKAKPAAAPTATEVAAAVAAS